MAQIIINVGATTGMGKSTTMAVIADALTKCGAKVEVFDDCNITDTMAKLEVAEEVLSGKEIVIKFTQLNRTAVSHSDIHSYNHPEGYVVRIPKG